MQSNLKFYKLFQVLSPADGVRRDVGLTFIFVQTESEMCVHTYENQNAPHPPPTQMENKRSSAKATAGAMSPFDLHDSAICIWLLGSFASGC